MKLAWAVHAARIELTGRTETERGAAAIAPVCNCSAVGETPREAAPSLVLSDPGRPEFPVNCVIYNRRLCRQESVLLILLALGLLRLLSGGEPWSVAIGASAIMSSKPTLKAPTRFKGACGLPAARLHGDAAQRQLSRQQGCIAEQALRGLRAGDELAAPMGEELGRREVLLRRLPTQQGCAWLSCVP